MHLIISITVHAFLFAMVLMPPINAAEPDELIIAHTWNGVALAPDEMASLTLTWMSNGNLKIIIDAPFEDDPKPKCEDISCWELWNYEVVELFLLGKSEDGAQSSEVPYTEIEISPWGNHLVLQLLGPRNITAKNLPLNSLSVTRNEKRWSAVAVVDKALIPNGELMVNAYRISGLEPDRHYHVMTPMMSEEPNFHLIDQFKRVFSRDLKIPNILK